MIAAVQSKNNRFVRCTGQRRGRASEDVPRRLIVTTNDHTRLPELTGRPLTQASEIYQRSAAIQRQTYDPFTSTRTHAVPAAAAPTAAPPTTARRVVRRATPATLTGVPGRPTLASALSIDSERPLLGDHVTDPRVPKAKTAVAKNARLMVIFFISISSAERTTENHPCSVCLIQVNKLG